MSIAYDDLPRVTWDDEETGDPGWEDVFKYAETASSVGPVKQDVPGFTIADAAAVLGGFAVSPDGGGSVDACVVLRLNDGRYASVWAWADYTGWGCQEDGKAFVADSLEAIWEQGLGNEERERIGSIESLREGQ